MPNKRYPEELFKNLAEDYERLGSRRAVAELYGCSEGLIQKRLQRQGITPHVNYAAMVAKQRSPEGREAKRQQVLRWCAEGRTISKRTELERIFEAALTAAGVEHRSQVLLGKYIVDFFVPPSTVVEVDGSQHYIFAGAREKDAVRDAWMREQGFRVLRFVGHQVRRDAAACVQMMVDQAVQDSPPFSWLSLEGYKYKRARTAETRERMAEQKRAHWRDPQKRAAMQSGIKAAQGRPEYGDKIREQRRQAAQALWSDPARHEKQRQAIADGVARREARRRGIVI